MEEELKPHRTLTDEDVKAIADTLKEEIVKQFYHDFGKGVWGIVWKVIIGILLTIAAWGAVRGSDGTNI